MRGVVPPLTDVNSYHPETSRGYPVDERNLSLASTTSTTLKSLERLISIAVGADWQIRVNRSSLAPTRESQVKLVSDLLSFATPRVDHNRIQAMALLSSSLAISSAAKPQSASTSAVCCPG